jgi:hypothetical protein
VDWTVRVLNPGRGKRFFFPPPKRSDRLWEPASLLCSVYWGLRSALFRDLTQRRLVIHYRRFGTTYRFHLQGPSSSSYSGGSLKYCIVLYCFAGGKATVAWRWTLTSSNAFVVSRNEQTQEEGLRGHTRDSYNTIITAVPWTRRSDVTFSGSLIFTLQLTRLLHKQGASTTCLYGWSGYCQSGLINCHTEGSTSYHTRHKSHENLCLNFHVIFYPSSRKVLG